MFAQKYVSIPSCYCKHFFIIHFFRLNYIVCRNNALQTPSCDWTTMCLADFFIYEINFKVFSGHLKQKSSVALQVTGCRSIVAAASGCHQNCLEAMSCVKTIEVIFEESRCHKIYYCFFVTGTCYIHDSTICSSTNEHMCSILFI